MRSFAKVKNEPRRAATLYNLAHLAYEQGDAAKAQGLAQASADLATELGITPLRLGALARVGLAALALGARDEVTRVARVLEEELSSSGWFTGRECVEAFQARRALHDGDHRGAQLAFIRAAEAVGNDPYDLAWLVAECSALFRTPGATMELRRLGQRARQDAERFGFGPLAKRLTLVALDVERGASSLRTPA
jgi:hypothetical protein